MTIPVDVTGKNCFILLQQHDGNSITTIPLCIGCTILQNDATANGRAELITVEIGDKGQSLGDKIISIELLTGANSGIYVTPVIDDLGNTVFNINDGSQLNYLLSGVYNYYVF